MSLLCHYHQFRLNHALDDGYEPSNNTLKHLKACSGCQSWYQNQRKLIGHLKGLGKSSATIKSPQLLPGVLASLRNHTDSIQSEPQKITPLPWQKWLMPIATTCVAVTLIIQYTNPAPPSKASTPTAKWLALSPAGLVQKTTGQSIADWGQQIDKPLEKEWLLLKEEAQAAAGGLAGTFIPSKFMASYQPVSAQQP